MTDRLQFIRQHKWLTAILMLSFPWPIAMRRNTKFLLWVGLSILVVAGVAWSVVNLRRGIVSAYYEWGVTCIIASYAENHDGMPPANWTDLVGYEYHTHYLPEPRTMELAAQHVSIDFEALLAFKMKRITELPANVVYPRRGFEQHWISPKYTLERYFRDGVRPHGSFSDEYADQQRHNAEGGE